MRARAAWPAAALSLEDFQSAVVTVDLDELTQYLFAADGRAERLAEFQDPTHPVVLALLRRIVQQAGARGVEVAVCGARAIRPERFRPLLATGIRNLVVSPRELARVKASLVEC